MEKNNGKIIAIAALVVAVVALSVGFAAFTDSLTIDGSATVKAGENVFAANFGYDANTTPSCVYTGGSTTAENTSAGTASDNTWSGISVQLTSEHPSVTCTAKVKNTSDYKASLTSISASGALSCSSTGANAATNTATICTGVTEEVQLGSSSNALTINSTSNGAGLTNSSPSLEVAKTNGEATVTVIVAYNTSVGTPDGDITVTLPTITHAYTTVAD